MRCLKVLETALPYLPGKTFFRLMQRPLVGPMCIPKLTLRLQNPKYGTHLVHTRSGTISIQMRAPLGSPTIALSIFPREHQLRVYINPGRNDSKTQARKIQETHP